MLHVHITNASLEKFLSVSVVKIVSFRNGQEMKTTVLLLTVVVTVWLILPYTFIRRHKIQRSGNFMVLNINCASPMLLTNARPV